jgi:hypothetical protein
VVERPLGDEALRTRTEHLTCAERHTLARAGYGEIPTEGEFLRELQARSVDDWFTLLSQPRFETEALATMANYADTMRVTVPGIKVLHGDRKRLEKLLGLTRDYLHALSMAAEVHLTQDQWRSIYPKLDAAKLVNPPTPHKLRRVTARVHRLEEEVAAAREAEKWALMDSVYPLAKEVERVMQDPTSAENKAAIAAFQARHKDYDRESKEADGLAKRMTFRVSADGNFIQFPGRPPALIPSPPS